MFFVNWCLNTWSDSPTKHVKHHFFLLSFFEPTCPVPKGLTYFFTDTHILPAQYWTACTIDFVMPFSLLVHNYPLLCTVCNMFTCYTVHMQICCLFYLLYAAACVLYIGCNCSRASLFAAISKIARRKTDYSKYNNCIINNQIIASFN